MGVENMAPMLYSLIRFNKPHRIIEVGAGYTSPFILQALKDNFDEISNYKLLMQQNQCHVEGTPWCVDKFMQKTDMEHFGVCVCLDNLEHANTTAQKVLAAAESLDLLDHLDIHFKDAWDYADTLASKIDDPDYVFDMAWLDFGQGEKLGEFIEKIWPSIRPGGLVLCHSTVTNSLTRGWLEKMRSRANDVTDVLGTFATMSFREPHKLFQNSFSIFQKRKNFDEPVFTKYP